MTQSLTYAAHTAPAPAKGACRAGALVGENFFARRSHGDVDIVDITSIRLCNRFCGEIR